MSDDEEQTDDSWTFIDKTDEETETREVSDPPEGITLYTEDGDPVRVVLMDEHDERLTLAANPEQGIYGYEGVDTTITMILEEP